MIVFAGLAALLCACQNTTFRSSVPAYPVHAEIHTTALFPDFRPENLNAYITVTKEGYKENGRFVLPLRVTDAYGYGGLVVYVSLNGYVAFDLACPNCAAKGKCMTCVMDEPNVNCPECGEQYNLLDGYAFPMNGICRETLRPLLITVQGDKLIITQRR